MAPKNRLFPLLALTCIGNLLVLDSAIAQDNDYPYGGISVGRSRGKSDASATAAYQIKGATPPLSASNLSQDDNDTAYRAFLGYQFNPYVGIEASFFHLGHFKTHADASPSGSLDGKFSIQGAGLDVVGAWPFADRWALLGRVGGQYARTRVTLSSSGTSSPLVSDTSPSARQFNYDLGAGLQYAINAHLLLRGEVQQYRTRNGIGGTERVQVFSLSVVVPFGAGAVSRKASATAPYQPVAYVAPAAPVTTAAAAPSVKVEAAPSAPMAAFAPATPTPLRVSFTAESLFGFDSSVIRLEGKSALDKFARDVAGTQFQVVVVEGHADRIGTENYNQALSLRRAEAVKAYLVSPGGMDESKISTRGLGEDSPSQAGECLASLPTAQLRACLQPDRRVDVDVNGQR